MSFSKLAGCVHCGRYTDNREMALLTLWLMSAFTFRVIFGTPLFLELCRHNALHPLWAARMTGVEAMVCCALMLRVSMPALRTSFRWSICFEPTNLHGSIFFCFSPRKDNDR